MGVAGTAALLLATSMRAIAMTDHELGEYLRVDEIARRFGVTIEDVLAACSVLGFEAHDAASLIEIGLLEEAVMHAPVHATATDSRTSLLLRVRIGVAATAAVLAAVLGVSLLPHGGTSPQQHAAQAAAAYKAKLKATYEATVTDSPAQPDYQALAQKLLTITPPAALSAEHAKLIAEAQDVADVATSGPDEVKSAIDSSPAAIALQQELAQLNALPTPYRH
jgi:hypothetical protein